MSKLIDKIIKEGLLTEKILNLFTPEQKKPYVDAVWDILQQSYAKVGGIKGNGFNSKEDMIKNVPFWKIVKHDGQIIAVSMYKDKNGRKRVASGQNGTMAGKHAYFKGQSEEVKMKRSFGEVSGPALKGYVKQFGEEGTAKLAIPYEKVNDYIDDEIRRPPEDDQESILYPLLKNFFYQREIGLGNEKHWHTKLMLGTPGNKIY